MNCSLCFLWILRYSNKIKTKNNKKIIIKLSKQLNLVKFNTAYRIVFFFALCASNVYQNHRLSIWRSVTQSLKKWFSRLFLLHKQLSTNFSDYLIEIADFFSFSFVFFRFSANWNTETATIENKEKERILNLCLHQVRCYRRNWVDDLAKNFESRKNKR